MQTTIQQAQASGVINPAFLNNEVVGLVPVKIFKKKGRKAYVKLAGGEFLKDSKGGFFIADETQIWEMRAAYIDKFSNNYREMLTAKIEDLKVICRNYVAQCKAESSDKNKIADLENAIKIDDYDFIASLIFEENERLNHFTLISDRQENDSHKSYLEMIANYLITKV
jgi:hypothetical protein